MSLRMQVLKFFCTPNNTNMEWRRKNILKMPVGRKSEPFYWEKKIGTKTNATHFNFYGVHARVSFFQSEFTHVRNVFGSVCLRNVLCMVIGNSIQGFVSLIWLCLSRVERALFRILQSKFYERSFSTTIWLFKLNEYAAKWIFARANAHACCLVSMLLTEWCWNQCWCGC